MRPRLRQLLWLSLSLVPFASFSSVQDSRNSSFVAVEVVDVTGAEVPNAQIKFVEFSTSAQTLCPSNSAGKATCALAPGAYTATVTFPGFRTSTQRLDAKSGETQSVRFVLQVGSCPPGCVQVADGLELTNIGNLEESARPVSVCQLVSKPELHNGKEVVVRGLYNHGYEWSVLHGPECSSQKDLVWLDPSHVADKASVKALGGLENTDTFNLTVRGIFMSGGHYGHRNRYQYQIVARELSDVQKLPPQK